MDSKAEREKKLAEALRANLRRRKAQGREADATETLPEGGGAPDDETDNA